MITTDRLDPDLVEGDDSENHKKQLRRVIREAGLWDNIRKARKKGGKRNHPNSKAYKNAVKAAKKINNEADSMYEAEDQNHDNVNDFEDVQIARMKASGMSGPEIKKKQPELFENFRSGKLGLPQLRRIIKEEKANLLNEAMTRSDVQDELEEINQIVVKLFSALDTGGYETPDMGGPDAEQQEHLRMTLDNIQYELDSLEMKMGG